ncbi:PREDICTED: E3 ubiquitin-protein ligase TRIM71-like [Amphimedon queenslandica]|uniref:RING-type domain-containing protein n=1 Tax=Amphimedon queenslandica TaxID=400682 RepID=A0A1X7V6Q5_AMPQE|nr:PREDICTED: E3 ubiquitin-protein ligase TRIM71-like [Amphimedon queenslandica]|eukprot:XP_011402998.1 PREDICTED: E3 ubiquitin-protein ligase TRIM71-like [Amphimedon queenslandica]
MAGKEVPVPLIKLQEQITCAKCFNVFTKPKTLSCLHSFCQQCIEGLATISTLSVACPTCHQHTELPAHARAAGFSVAPQIVELKQMYDSQSVHVKCDICQDNIIASGYCKECNLSICHQCIEKHKDWPHEIKEFDEPLNDRLPVDKEVASHLKTILSAIGGRKAEIREQGEAVKKEIRSLLKSTIEDKFMEEIDEIVARKLQLLEKQKEESLNASGKIEEFHLVEKADIQFIRSNNDSISHHVGRIVSSAGLEECKVKEITAIKHIPKDQAISFELSIESPDDERSLLVLPASSLSLNVVVTPTITKPCQVINARVIPTDKPGVYQVICTPVIRGRHQVNVRALGVQLKLPSSFTIPFNPYDAAPIRVIPGVDNPRGIAVSDDGLIVVSEYKPCIMSIMIKEGKKLKSFSEGAALGFSRNNGLDIMEDSSILVADTDNHRILKISMDGKCDPVGGSRGAGELQFQFPTGVTASPINKHIYVADKNNHRVQVLNYDLKFCPGFGKSGTGNGEFNQPVDVAVDKEGNIYVTDSYNHRIQKFTHDGNYICQFGSQGSGPGQLNYPAGITVDTTGLVFVSECNNHRVSIFTSDGQYVNHFGGKGQNKDQFDSPYVGITFDKDGRLYVCDNLNNRIVVY